ncbi:hypothetical protein Lal_00048348 [Lupinus albus]|uniref:von Willebrand factor, type A n=1 Tax=Lupinus albus TaxID=3870 RepID=A0A6A5M995_LUPAL|nr:hypothetical protein Lalb_Chr04g0253271 [Lupinus albus]KAF1869068.1 hypothetical protein Lal_00048348 [Lupinus albus]
MPTLLGPPQLYTPKPQLPQNATTAAAAPSDPFIDLMVAEFNRTAVTPPPPMGYTENLSPTFVSSGNPCLDFFFHVVPDTSSDTLYQRLQLAWSHNPLTTLKLICNLRAVRGTGKSDRQGFYSTALWLYDHHPKTLASNVPSFADFGYFKDLPEILYRILEGSEVRKIQKDEWNRRKLGKSRASKVNECGGRGLEIGKKLKKNNKNGKSLDSREVRVTNEKTRVKIEKERVSAAREDKKIAFAKKLVNRYSTDLNFRLLHDSVSDHFAECLKLDLENLKSGSLKKISLAAKWCPSVDSSFDRSTLLCEGIAKRIFPRDVYTEYDGIEEAHYAYRVRDRLRKDVLVPLRKVLELPEVFIGANHWDLIPYNRVASVAMKFYKEKFLKHDKERFEKYLEDVKSGKKTIAAGALLPHEIIGSLWDEDGGEVAELQWKRMVDDILKKGKMKNCIAVCDVSGSMCGDPMEVSVALGLLVSELSVEPWKGKVITFSEKPELHLIEGDNLKSKTAFVRNMDWGYNTDFQRVFDLILQVALNGKLKEDQMVKRVFVFSDMEFDVASVNPWETDYQAITRKFNEKGYGSAVPQIVFWNLRDSKATPVPATQKGVALVSGFSKNLLTLFLDNEGDLYPEDAMEAAISGPEYQKLVVMD